MCRARPTASSGNPPPNRVPLIRCDNLDAWNKYDAISKKLIKEDGEKYADFRIYVIEGMEQK